MINLVETIIYLIIILKVYAEMVTIMGLNPWIAVGFAKLRVRVEDHLMMEDIVHTIQTRMEEHVKTLQALMQMENI